MPATRLAIIGAGIMGERMLRAAHQSRGAIEVAAVWDQDPAATDRLSALAPGFTPNAAAAIEAADCVYIATPPATHLAYARQALDAGRAVFLEKPLATNVPEAEAFVRQHEDSRVAVNFPFASSFAVARLHEWLTEGAVGTPSRLDINVAFATWPRPWQQAAAAWLDHPTEGGFTREVASHFLFLARRLLGPLSLDSARIDRPAGQTERRIEARLDAGGIPVHLTGAVGEIEQDDHNTWTLLGTGAIRLRDWSYAERQSPAGNWTPDADAASNEQMRPLVLRRQLEGVARMTQGEPHHLATLVEAFEVQAIVEAILAPPTANMPAHA